MVIICDNKNCVERYNAMVFNNEPIGSIYPQETFEVLQQVRALWDEVEPEAQALYEDLSPEKIVRPKNPRYEGKGRPTKKDRRDMGPRLSGKGSFDLE